MLSSNFIAPSVYNTLPDIDDTTAIPDETLEALGSLLSRYNVEQLVGIGLLHKHFDLAEDTAMVHHGLVCKPESIKGPNLATGKSFFWDGASFQAFEYGHETPLALAHEFLTDLAKYLETHGLTEKVAVSKLAVDKISGRPEKLFMEYLNYATKCHICVETSEIQPHQATQWIFEGGVPFVTHACSRTNAGEGDYYHKSKWIPGQS